MADIAEHPRGRISPSQASKSDPLGIGTTADKFAVVWFCLVLVVASIGVYVLSRIDWHMRSTNGYYLNYDAYRENRQGWFGMPTAVLDDRQDGTVTTARERAQDVPSQ
ncbi:MAG: hypothetical protein KDD44_10230 [Bdellovibrionales bacterium]|nr:hypothetical protein [Bdellovibrionales bacterium]